MTLKNRIVMPAMASYHAAVNGEATEKLIRYHEERAKGGVGMNIVEATYVARSGNSFDLGLGISDDFMIKGLSKLTDAVHRHDGKIAIQLQHGGRFGNPPTSGCPRLLVSMIPGLAPTENARVMDADDIEGITRLTDVPTSTTSSPLRNMAWLPPRVPASLHTWMNWYRDGWQTVPLTA